MPKIVKNIRVHIQFCSLQANLLESIRFVNNDSSIFCSRASFKDQEGEQCLYRAPFARASDAGCALPHRVYNSDALL